MKELCITKDVKPLSSQLTFGPITVKEGAGPLRGFRDYPLPVAMLSGPGSLAGRGPESAPRTGQF